MAGYSKTEIGDAVLHRDNIPAPATAPDRVKNTKWTLSSYVQSIYNAVVGLPSAVAALRKDVAGLRADVAALRKES